MDILSYLEKDYKSLKNEIESFNGTLFNSPHSAIIKGRIIAEKLLSEISCLESDMFINGTSQDERLKEFMLKGVLNIETYTLFNTVRLIGNKAAHDEIEGELEAALNIHKNIYKLIGWFIEVYLDPYFEAPVYKGPSLPKNKAANIDENVIAKLLKQVVKGQLTPTKVSSEKNKKVPSEVINAVSEGPDLRCLVKEISKLRESSKEAVEGLVEFTDFKKYMHIEREAQTKLHNIIESANQSKRAQLILVSGSVGDGKSHIISYFKNKYPDLMNNFILHNDATESLEPTKTSTDTLNEILDGFSDGKIKENTEKVILAINLGTLNNFIDSEYGTRFSILKEYVNDKKIIEASIKYNGYDEISFFQFINFSDYHIFTLKNGKVSSNYIKSLISRVTSSSELNIFYNSYQNNCCKCDSRDSCPIKYNYEYLGNKVVQEAIVDLLVQCVIKNKIIISTRALMNFIYELIVPRAYIDINSPTLKGDILKISTIKYIRSLMPNIMFNHKELSFIFEALNSLDPLDVRNEEVDGFIIKFNNSTEILDYFKRYIDFSGRYINIINDINLQETDGEEIRYELLKLFIRSYYMSGKDNLFSLKDRVYQSYMENIYFWNKGDKTNLIRLYEDVKSGILKWNGEADKEQINIFLGKSQIKYKISEDIELKADTSNLPQNKKEELNKFMTTLKLEYKGNISQESYTIDIDFALYKLLLQINNGYRPNRKDKNQFISFVEFIGKLEETGSQKKKLVFTEKSKKINKKYKLEYDTEFEFYRFMEINI